MSAVKPKQMPTGGIIVVLLIGLLLISILDGLFESHLKWSDVQQARSSVESALAQKPDKKGFEGIWLQAKQLAYAHHKHEKFVHINYGIGWSVLPRPKDWMSYNDFKKRIFCADNHDKLFRLFGGCLDSKTKSYWMYSEYNIHIPLEDRGQDYDHFDDEAVYFFLCAAQQYNAMSFNDLWESEYTRFIVPRIVETADLHGLPCLWSDLHYDPLDRLDRATLEAILPVALKGRFVFKPLTLQEYARDEFQWQFQRQPNQVELKRMTVKEYQSWQKYCRDDVPKMRAERQRERTTVVELLRSMDL